MEQKYDQASAQLFGSKTSQTRLQGVSLVSNLVTDIEAVGASRHFGPGVPSNKPADTQSSDMSNPMPQVKRGCFPFRFLGLGKKNATNQLQSSASVSGQVGYPMVVPHSLDLGLKAAASGGKQNAESILISDQQALCLVKTVLQTFDGEKALSGILDKKFRISNREQSEKVLNELQALRSMLYHLPSASQKNPTIIDELFQAHMLIMKALPELTNDSNSSVFILLESTAVALSLVDLFCACLNDDTNDARTRHLQKVIKRSSCKDMIAAKKEWISYVIDTRYRLKSLAAQLRAVNAPLLILNSNLNILETAILALRDPDEKSKAALALGGALFSMAKSVGQGSLDKNLLNTLATLGSMAVDKMKQMNASRIYLSIHQLNQIKTSSINFLCTPEGRDVQGQEDIKKMLRSLQSNIMINTNADLFSNFVELISEILLGPQSIQLKKIPSDAAKHTPAPVQLRVGYSIKDLDTQFALWLVNGEQSAHSNAYLGLQGFSSIGLKADYMPDPSLRMREWGTTAFADICRQDFHCLDQVDSLREVIEDDFCAGVEEFRSKLQDLVHHKGIELVKQVFKQIFIPFSDVQNCTSDYLQRTLRSLDADNLENFSDALREFWTRIRQKIEQKQTLTGMSSKILAKWEAHLMNGKELLAQVLKLLFDVQEILSKGKAVFEKSRSFLMPALRMMETISDEIGIDSKSDEADVLKNTVEMMQTTLSVLETMITCLDEGIQRLVDAHAYINQYPVEQMNKGYQVLLELQQNLTLENSEISDGDECYYDLNYFMYNIMDSCNDLVKTVYEISGSGKELMSACETSRRLFSMLQCKPVKLSDSDHALDGIYGASIQTKPDEDGVPKIEMRGGKPEFESVNGDFVLFYNDYDEEQGWCVGKKGDSDSHMLRSNSKAEVPHLIEEDTCWTKISQDGLESSSCSISIAVASSVLDSKIVGQLKEQVMTKLQDVRDGVVSVASDLFGDAYEKSEAMYKDVRGDFTNAIEDLDEIQMEVADLLTPFKPFNDVATGAASLGFSFMKQGRAKKELYTVRASSFFVLIKLKTCLTSAIAARAKGIGYQPRLDLSTLLQVVESSIVRCRTLETDRRMKAFFKTTSVAAEHWQHRNTGFRDFAKEKLESIGTIDSLIDEMAVEQDPLKKQKMLQELEAHTSKIAQEMKNNKNGSDVLYSMLINQAHAAASMKSEIKSMSSSSNFVSKEAWEDQEQQIQNELRANLEKLAQRQEQIKSEPDVNIKQTVMMQVRQEQIAIATQLSNVEDVGSALGITVSFLQGLQGQFDAISSKLDDLAVAVKDIADNVRLLVGRPVLEVLETRRLEFITKRRNRLSESVYIPSECLQKGRMCGICLVHLPGTELRKIEACCEIFSPKYVCEGCAVDVKKIRQEEKKEQEQEVNLKRKQAEDPRQCSAESGALLNSESQDSGAESNDAPTKHVCPLCREPINVGGKRDTVVSQPLFAEKANPNGKLETLQERKPLMPMMKEFLAKDGSPNSGPLSRKGVMLIHGPAGSGKSSFARELEFYILGEYYEERRKKNDETTVILIKSQLQMLQKPLTAIFNETLRCQYGLREVQIHSLMDKILHGNFEVIFLLDGYDEMRPEFRNKNLFTTNNFEQFRKGGQSSTEQNFPKVIYLSRSELFAGNSDYIKPFVPIEADNREKDEFHEAVKFYHELKLASFEKSLDAFLSAHCALELRKAFEERCNFFKPDVPISEKLSTYEENLIEVVSKALKAAKKTGNKVAILAMAAALRSDSDQFEKEFLKLRKDYEPVKTKKVDDEVNVSSSAKKKKKKKRKKRKKKKQDNVVVEEGQEEEEEGGCISYWCDGCDTMISGARWSCIDCKDCKDEDSDFDFDLCQECHSQFLDSGKHHYQLHKFVEFEEEEEEEGPEELDEEKLPIERAGDENVEDETKKSDDRAQGDDQNEALDQMRTIVTMLDDFRIKCESVTKKQGQTHEDEDKIKQFEQQRKEKIIEIVEAAFSNDVWTQSMYTFRINCITGLKELTSTPFMVKIVVDIMPVLHSMSATPQDIKQKMLLLLGDESVVEQAWALLRKDLSVEGKSFPDSLYKKPICSTVAHLSQTQKLLKDEDNDEYSYVYQRLEKIAEKLRENDKTAPDFDHTKTLPILLKVLKQQATRRYSIYAVFTEQWVKRAVHGRSATRSVPLSPDQVISEAWSYMQRLASLLVEKGLSKVQYDQGNLLVSNKDDELRNFFDLTEQTNNLGEVRRLALDVSPIAKEGSFYSFIHKSILEFLVAKQVHDDIMTSIHRTRLSPSNLLKILKRLQESPHQDIVVLLTEVPHLSGLKKASDQRRVAKALMALIADVQDSSINKIDLDEEEAVCDFVIDCLLDDVEFCTAFGIIAALCRVHQLHGGSLSLAYDNILATCTAKKVKRGGGNILHVASQEDNLFLLDTVLDILNQATDRGDIVRQTIEANMHIGLPHSGKTPLLVAAQGGHPDAVQRLVTSKADLDAKDQQGSSVLHLAAEHGQARVIEVLLQMDIVGGGAGLANLLMLTDEEDMSCLHVAAECGKVKAAEMVMEQGGRKLIMLQSTNGSYQLPGGEEVKEQGWSALHFAVDGAEQGNENGDGKVNTGAHVEVAQLLLKTATGRDLLMLVSKNGRSCLHVAAHRGLSKMAKVLIDKSCEDCTDLLMLIDNEGKNCLHWAVNYVNPDMDVDDDGAKLENDEKEEIHDAHVKIVQELIQEAVKLEKKLAFVSLTDQDGINCLDLAHKNGYDKCIEELKKHSAKHSIIYAAQRGMDLEVRDRIAEHADINACNMDGLCALDLAVRNQNENDDTNEKGCAECMQLLRDAGAKHSFLYAAQEGLHEVVSNYISEGENAALNKLGTLNKLRMTGLMLACTKGTADNTATAEMLVQPTFAAGALNVQGLNGYSALTWAVDRGLTNVVSKLNECGALPCYPELSIFRGDWQLAEVNVTSQTVKFQGKSHEHSTFRSRRRCPLGRMGYFEITILAPDAWFPRYGFVSAMFEKSEDTAEGSKDTAEGVEDTAEVDEGVNLVGGDSNSWGIDGENNIISHDGECYDYNCKKWETGDTLGFACNLEKMEIWVSVNGCFDTPHGKVFDLSPNAVRHGLFAAGSGSEGTLCYNLGENPFKHGPPTPDYCAFIKFASTYDEDKMSSLLWACYFGDEMAASKMIEQTKTSGELDLQHTCTRMSFLMAASQNGHSGIVEKLLAAGSKTNLTDKEGMTALMLACVNGHEDSAKVLVQPTKAAGALDVRSTARTGSNSHGGFSALMWAEEMGLVRVMNMLRQSGAAVVRRPALSFFRGDMDVEDLQFNTIDKTVAFQLLTTLRSRNSCPPGAMGYYEVEIIEVDNLCPQYGFVSPAFKRFSMKTYEGVGDDNYSWAVDGARKMKWHGVNDDAFNVEALIKAFQDLDTSRNGYLSIEALGPFLKNVAGADEEDQQSYFHELDEDGSGEVSQNEFLVFMDKKSEAEKREVCMMIQRMVHDKYGCTWKKGDVIGLACDLKSTPPAIWLSVNGNYDAPNGRVFDLSTNDARHGLFAGLTGAAGKFRYNLGEENFKYDPPSSAYQAFSTFDNVLDSSLFHSEPSEP